MKRAVVLLLVALVLVSTACLVGCGEDKAIIKRTDGEVDTGENGVSTTEVSEGDLGVPIYPGAEMIEGASGTVTTTSEQGEATWSGAELITDDSFPEVVAWYKEQLSGKNGFADTSMVSEDTEIGMFTFQEGDSVKTVIINHGGDDLEGKTVVEINSGSGPMFESQ